MNSEETVHVGIERMDEDDPALTLKKNNPTMDIESEEATTNVNVNVDIIKDFPADDHAENGVIEMDATSMTVQENKLNEKENREADLVENAVEHHPLGIQNGAENNFQEVVQNQGSSGVTQSESFGQVVKEHQVKWIRFASDGAAGSSMFPVLTQNKNGPCPLLAIVNVLFLRGQARLEQDLHTVSSEMLLDIVRDCISRLTPEEYAHPTHHVDYQRNVEDAFASLPKLLTGLDVNVRFTGVDQFEHTPELLVFDLLNIPLYHGWLVEPEGTPVTEAVAHRSYNQLMEFIIDGKHSNDSEKVVAATLADEFVTATATQLTYRGLVELNAHLKDGALCVFFRNNHFSTLVKHDNELFCLVTDSGFLNRPRIVWESLNCVDGDSRFVDMEFRTVPPETTSATPPTFATAALLAPDASPQEQIDHDLMVALSLEEEENAKITAAEAPDSTVGGANIEERDRLLALKLQEEEDKLAAQEQRQGAVEGASGSQRASPDVAPSTAGRNSSGGKKDKCCIM